LVKSTKYESLILLFSVFLLLLLYADIFSTIFLNALNLCSSLMINTLMIIPLPAEQVQLTKKDIAPHSYNVWYFKPSQRKELQTKF